MQVGTDNDRLFFFFNDTATTEIYTLTLHDALPISLDNDPQKHLGRQVWSRTRTAKRVKGAREHERDPGYTLSYQDLA